jgi:hypothetical protein
MKLNRMREPVGFDCTMSTGIDDALASDDADEIDLAV